MIDVVIKWFDGAVCIVGYHKSALLLLIPSVLLGF